MIKKLLSGCALLALSFTVAAQDTEPTNLYWGDTHLHTSYSFDAFMNENKSADPDTAYRWAKGQPVIHPYNRARVQLERPLDFLVVADHAELMGVIRAINFDLVEELPEMGWWDSLYRWFAINTLNDKIEEGTAADVFVDLLPKEMANPGGDPVQDPNNRMPTRTFGNTNAIEQIAWNEIVDAAEKHNEPGKFTSLIGWEWSSIPTGANLHRIVMSPDGGDTAKQYLPYGSDESQYPEDLWAWLEATSERTGAKFLAIPHNSNISKGYMFQETTLKGEPITEEYATRRSFWEPVTEITQIKGDSETHPNLSPEDEFADFETYGFYIQNSEKPYTYKPGKGDYIRSALKTGLKLESKVGVNPYQFGVIGSTDSHSGLASADEDNFWGKMARDSIPEAKKDFGIGRRTVNGWNMAAQGLAAVWAEENTRESIFNAFKRKEVYGTTGPRMRVRFFAGWGFDGFDAEAGNIAEVGYAGGVPMGGDFSSSNEEGATPEFLIQAVKDPVGANLDRVQVVKGWLDAGGQLHEKVFDVAWSGSRTIGANGKLPAIGDTVDRTTGKTDNTIGTPELITKWSDPEFNPNERAFYYVRVLQIPTARHSLLDAIALGLDNAPEEGPEVIQERAYTSAIWYKP
ncbi:DUF3604 domain-containing protein [Kordiimonas laminariae]|uniref:DUF3604 domain-containing protein n=1 Tax=Kordiimonas laminariae TaxID=2917717 RepID=UPI001FF2885F|nr:DUF3604 domain-containing protein [Kordiimonas laminariae]MCK0068244.1 DUF3604 domain-containing protein [Kordiimonas laminariae]